MDQSLVMFSGIASCAFIRECFLWYIANCRQSLYVPVGKLTDICLYPVKSTSATVLNDALCTETGLVDIKSGTHDRILVAYNPKTRYFLNLRTAPGLALVSCKLSDHGAWLNAPERKALFVDFQKKHDINNAILVQVLRHSMPMFDCGDDVARWLSEHLKLPDVRLAYAAPQLEKRHPTDPRFKAGATVAGAYLSPFLLTSTSSLGEVNRRLKKEVTMASFRPNLVVSCDKPFDEDSWSSVRIRDVIFTPMKPCGRCLDTTIDPETGTKNESGEPLSTLRRFRQLNHLDTRSPLFGVNLGLGGPGGVVSVGDTVYALHDEKFYERLVKG